MFCPNCGNQLHLTDQKFCAHCGGDVSMLAQDKAASSPVVVPSPPVSATPLLDAAGYKRSEASVPDVTPQPVSATPLLDAAGITHGAKAPGLKPGTPAPWSPGASSSLDDSARESFGDLRNSQAQAGHQRARLPASGNWGDVGNDDLNNTAVAFIAGGALITIGAILPWAMEDVPSLFSSSTSSIPVSAPGAIYYAIWGVWIVILGGMYLHRPGFPGSRNPWIFGTRGWWSFAVVASAAYCWYWLSTLSSSVYGSFSFSPALGLFAVTLGAAVVALASMFGESDS
jgi:hypothetical protein